MTTRRANQPPAVVLPPNQALAGAGKWPVVGESEPRDDASPWRVSVAGLVSAPQSWDLAELQSAGGEERLVDVHCVTRWSKPGMRFGGVPLRRLLDAARPDPRARFVSFVARSARAHATSLPLADVLALDPLVAFTAEGRPLETRHGGPVRMVVPGRYFYKSVKWLERVDLLAEDRLGYWEGEVGYHNRADPWREERFVVRSLDRRAVAAMIRARDVAGRDLLGMAAPGLDLAGLNARGALLRNADFRRARLTGARFDGANLSNARLDGADLSAASFRDADLEGASLLGCDLRGADLRGASLFGASFAPEPSHPPGHDPGMSDPGMADPGMSAACLDASTRLDRRQLEALNDVQRSYLAAVEAAGLRIDP